jgi:hypothetical protein
MGGRRMKIFSKEDVDKIKLEYEPGQVVELTAPMVDPHSPKPVGARATVTGVDDAGHLQCLWKDGGSLALIPDIDSFKKIPTITDTPFGQLLSIRAEGKVNMFDVKAVFELALKKDYIELCDVLFLMTNLYTHCILTGERTMT